MIQIKNVKPVNFLFYRTETQVDQLFQLVPKAKDLFKEAVALNLHITGPVHWHYFNFTGDVSKPFTLEIALPVDQIPAEYDGPFHFKRSDSFNCLSIIHEGGWLQIPESYAKLMQFIGANKLTPLPISRELYINADFAHPDANVTEIQMGIINEA